MRQERGTASGFWLVTAALCIIILVLPGIAAAGNLTDNTSVPVNATGTVPEATSPPATQVPTDTPDLENTTVEPASPPYLILGIPEIHNLTCNMYGTAAPGSGNVTIESIRWDWDERWLLICGKRIRI